MREFDALGKYYSRAISCKPYEICNYNKSLTIYDKLNLKNIKLAFGWKDLREGFQIQVNGFIIIIIIMIIGEWNGLKYPTGLTTLKDHKESTAHIPVILRAKMRQLNHTLSNDET